MNLELMMSSFKKLIGSVKVERKMGNLRYHMLGPVIIIVLSAEIMAVVEIKMTRESLVSVSGGYLYTGITQMTLINAFNNIEGIEKDIVIYHIVLNMKFGEIARIIEMPQSTVFAKYKSAINKIRKSI